MKKVLFFLLAMGLLAGKANAELIDRGGGLIYDTDLNITWLQDANYARTSGYTTGGFTYYDALAWVNQLVYRGIDGWRLPSAGSNPQQGYYQASNELGHLFYIELQIPAGTSSTTPINTGPFINLEHGWYWLESELEPYLGGAWYFVFNTGFMHATGKDSGANAWAVHDGDVGLGVITISIDIYNTGVDDYGALLPGASIDPHYTLITSADLRFPGPEAFVVVPSGYPLPGRWFANNSTSQWIAPQAKDFAGSGSPDALADGIYIYRTTFSLSGLDPLTAVLTGGWSTDNAGVDILINGVSTGFTTGIAQFEQGFASFSISSGFVHGENTLDFVVRNGALGYWENSPTGLRVEITGTADPLLEPLYIDIKPGSYPNSINPKSKGKIPVAILSTKDFDAPSQVDQNSLTFGASGDEASLAFCNPKGEDINGDGLKDLVCHFYTQDAAFECGDTEGVLKGKTMDGTPIEGRDSVRINPCK